MGNHFEQPCAKMNRSAVLTVFQDSLGISFVLCTRRRGTQRQNGNDQAKDLHPRERHTASQSNYDIKNDFIAYRSRKRDFRHSSFSHWSWHPQESWHSPDTVNRPGAPTSIWQKWRLIHQVRGQSRIKKGNPKSHSFLPFDYLWRLMQPKFVEHRHRESHTIHPFLHGLYGENESW